MKRTTFSITQLSFDVTTPGTPGNPREYAQKPYVIARNYNASQKTVQICQNFPEISTDFNNFWQVDGKMS